MTKIFFFIFSLALLCLNASNLQKANKFLSQNNIQQAIKFYKLSARNGEDEANFQLGKIYYLQNYNIKDLPKAADYFKKAADYGHIKAKYNLAMIYSQKQFTKHSYKDAYSLLLDLAKQDHPPSQYMVGIYLLYGLGIEKDYKLAKAWIERAFFENQYIEASCGISLIYAEGLGVIQNLGRARKFSEKYRSQFSLCKNIYNDFKLYKDKYKEDKGFKLGYYK